jgi:hypothetical protein
MLCWLVLLIPLLSNGQADPARAFVRQAPIVKFSLLSLLDPVSSVQFAVEHQLGRKTALQHEAGVIMPLNDIETKIRSQYGVRLRNELRLYLTPRGERLRGLYLAPEFLFLYYKGMRSQVVGRDCGDWGNCAFFENVDYTTQKQVYAFTQKMGVQEFIGQRFVFDFYWGLGLRHVRVREPDKPDNGMFMGWAERGSIFRKQHGNITLPNLSLGFKLGYLIHAPQRYVPAYNN